jgi:nucleoside-diphosphate-sugar epimerase
MKKVLVTGATGFIGRQLVRRLKSEGLDVYGISRNGGVIDNSIVDAVNLADAKQIEIWQKGKNLDAIIHTAAQIPSNFRGSDAQECFMSNIGAMLNVLHLAISYKCHLIYTSSTSVYGTIQRSDQPVTEAHANPDNFYSNSKYVGDVLCQQMAQSDSLSYTSLRISAPYGPGCKRSTVINIFLKYALTGQNITLYGSGERTQDFTYIDDVVEAIWLGLSKRPTGIFNIASGNPVSMKTLAQTVLQAIPTSNSSIIYSGEVDPQENYRAIFSIDKAHQQFGWFPRVDLIEGLQATAEVLKQEN